jgi:hypothetical protein
MATEQVVRWVQLMVIDPLSSLLRATIITPRIEEFFNSWCDDYVDEPIGSPLQSSLRAGGEFATSVRDRIVQARDLLEREQAEAGDEIGVRAARSRLAYLLAVAADHGVASTSSVAPCRTT